MKRLWITSHRPSAGFRSGVALGSMKTITVLARRRGRVCRREGEPEHASADGCRFETELLLGADGLRSAVRAQTTGPLEPVYSGYTSWRGTTPDGSVPPPQHMSESWGHGGRFGIVEIGFGELYWFAVANAPPQGRDVDVKADLLRRFGDWHSPIRGFLEATPVERILRTDISDRDPITRWHEGRVVLLGDVAHPMTPNLGQGAGQAIEDAVALDASLAAYDDVEVALRAFEHARVARANAFVVGSRRLGRVRSRRARVGAWVRERQCPARRSTGAVGCEPVEGPPRMGRLRLDRDSIPRSSTRTASTSVREWSRPFRGLRPVPGGGLRMNPALRRWIRPPRVLWRRHRGRRLLAEAAWAYQGTPRIGRQMLYRQEALPKRVCDIAWKAQLRLTSRFRRLVARGKAKPKVATAVARALTGFIWAIAREVPAPPA